MNDRKLLDLTAFLCIALLCSLWGGQQVLFKLTIYDIHPNMQIALRSGIGCVLLAAFMWHKGVSLALWRGPWRAGTMVGSLFALEWWMIGEALRYTSASHVVVFLYTAPIFTALGLHVWRPDERLNWWQWAGVLICFSGIGLAFLGSSAATQLDPQMWLGDCLALGGGVLWAATTVIIRCSGLARIAATQTTMYQLFIGALVILLLCIVLGETEIHWSPLLVVSIVGQGVVISFFSLLFSMDLATQTLFGLEGFDFYLYSAADRRRLGCVVVRRASAQRVYMGCLDGDGGGDFGEPCASNPTVKRSIVVPCV